MSDTEFKVYDKVWIMENNKPVEKLVFAVVECMNFYKTGTERSYRLVNGYVGATWGNSNPYSHKSVFSSREELIEKLGA